MERVQGGRSGRAQCCLAGRSLRAFRALAHSKIRIAFALQASLASLRRRVSTGLGPRWGDGRAAACLSANARGALRHFLAQRRDFCRRQAGVAAGVGHSGFLGRGLLWGPLGTARCSRSGRSRRPSWPSLTACPRRFALQASLAPIAPPASTGPSLAHVLLPAGRSGAPGGHNRWRFADRSSFT